MKRIVAIIIACVLLVSGCNQEVHTNGDSVDIENGLINLSEVLSVDDSRKEWIDHDEAIKTYIGSDLMSLMEYVEATGDQSPFIDKLVEYYDYEDTAFIYPFGDDDSTYPNENEVEEYKSKSSFNELTLNETLDLASKLFVDDEGNDPCIRLDQHEWSEYTLLSGRVHWTKFFMQYDEKGDYVTGHTWSESIRKTNT